MEFLTIILVVCLYFCFYTSDELIIFLCVAEYLDGLKSKEEIYNKVYEDIQNNLLNRL